MTVDLIDDDTNYFTYLTTELYREQLKVLMFTIEGGVDKMWDRCGWS